MSKNSTILSVSIPIDDAKFLHESEISASGIFQDKIKEIRRVVEASKSEKEKLLKNIELYQQRMVHFNEFLEFKGIKIEEFYKWRHETHGIK